METLDFSEILKWIDKNGPASICIEAAHIYMNEKPGEDHEIGAEIGASLCKEIQKAGNRKITKMILVDNYNPRPEECILDVNEYVSHLEGQEFAPDLIVYESTLEIPAQHMSNALPDDYLIKEGGKVFLNQGKSLLLEHGRPTCCLLDSVLYMVKFTLFDLAITILQNSFKDQQKKVRQILRTLGYSRLPVINVYFDEKQQITIGAQS